MSTAEQYKIPAVIVQFLLDCVEDTAIGLLMGRAFDGTWYSFTLTDDGLASDEAADVLAKLRAEATAAFLADTGGMVN